jgi:Enolase, C-terminal TIM barrel domain
VPSLRQFHGSKVANSVERTSSRRYKRFQNRAGIVSEQNETSRAARALCASVHRDVEGLCSRTGETRGPAEAGSLSRSNRLTKYNQLIRIEQELGGGALCSGKSLLCSR